MALEASRLDANAAIVTGASRGLGRAMSLPLAEAVADGPLGAGAAGLPGYSAYSASKGGVIALTKALAVEWARFNIQVNAVAPGWFVTDMNSEAFADAKVRERLLRDVPLRRTGRVEEIGPLVVYLASSASDYMTGQTVFLDGGHTAG